MIKVLTIGEPLVVFISNDIDKDLVSAKSFNKDIAGAELNVVIGLNRLNIQAEYISSVGNDIFGKFLIQDLKSKNISVDKITVDNNNQTGFYFKELVSEGDPKVEYFRKGSAASKLELNNLDLTDVKVAHLTGIMAAISKEGRKNVEYILDECIKKNILTTFDPNLRPSLWESKEVMINTLNYLATKASVFMPGISEARLLSGLENVEEICDYYLKSPNTNIVVVKLGAKGAYVKEKGKQGFNVPGFKVTNVVDTVGAGDGFAVGFLSGLMEDKDLMESVTRACAIGAMAVGSYGDNDGYPTRNELVEFMKGEKNVK